MRQRVGGPKAQDMQLPSIPEHLHHGNEGLFREKLGGSRNIVQIGLHDGAQHVLDRRDRADGPFDPADRVKSLNELIAKVVLHLAEAVEAENRREPHDGGIGDPEPPGDLGGGHEDHLVRVGTEVVHHFLLTESERGGTFLKQALGADHS